MADMTIINAARESKLNPDTKYYVIEFLDNVKGTYYVTEQTYSDLDADKIKVKYILKGGKIIERR